MEDDRSGNKLVGADVCGGMAGSEVDVVGNGVEGTGLVDGGGCQGGEVEVAAGRIDEPGGDGFDEIAGQIDGAGIAFDREAGAAEQVVFDDEVIVGVDDAEQAAIRTVRIVNGVMDDDTVAGMVGDDIAFGTAGNKIVADDDVIAMAARTASAGVAQGNAGIAIDDDITFDDTVPAVVPEEDSAAGLGGFAVDVEKNVVADGPVRGVHDVDAANVIVAHRGALIGIFPGIIAVLLGAVIIEKAILHTAGVDPLGGVITIGDFGAFDVALPDVVADDVIDGGVMGVEVGVDFDTVLGDVLDGEVGDSNTSSMADGDTLAVDTVGEIKYDTGPVAGSAAQGDLVGLQGQGAGHGVMAVGKQNGCAGLKTGGGLVEFGGGGDFDDRTGGRLQRGRLGVPGLLEYFRGDFRPEKGCY